MSEKFIIVQGAQCFCKFGKTPDKLKVLTHKKEYANDKDATKKLIATDKEIGATSFEKNTFGSCSKMNNSPCKPVITKWEGFYEEVTLSNGGKMLLEDSKATCAVAGTSCIEFLSNGQISEPSNQNFENADADLQGQINPIVDVEDILSDNEENDYGIDQAN